MTKSLIAFLPAATIVVGAIAIGAAYIMEGGFYTKPASAQQGMSQYVPETKWEVDTTPLNVLLDNGWFIHATAGLEGQVIVLFKDKKFMRCNLNVPKNSNMLIDMEDKTFSVCHKLN